MTSTFFSDNNHYKSTKLNYQRSSKPNDCKNKPLKFSAKRFYDTLYTLMPNFTNMGYDISSNS